MNQNIFFKILAFITASIFTTYLPLLPSESEEDKYNSLAIIKSI